MAKYTEKLGVLIKAGFFGENGKDLIGWYPIYKEEEREELNKKIIEHFWSWEIAGETPARFKFFLNRKLNEVMPLINQRWESQWMYVKGYNPLWNIGLTDSYTREVKNKDTSNTTNEASSTSKDTSNSTNENTTTGKTSISNEDKSTLVYNEVPVSGITQEEIDNNTYVTNYNRNRNVGLNTTTTDSKVMNETDSSNKNTTETEGETNTTNEGNMIETFTHRQDGSSAGLSFSHAIGQWREILINIHMEVIQALEPCFIGLW